MRRNRALYVLVSLCILFALIAGPMPRVESAKPTIKALVTDKSNLSLGNQFGPAGAYDLTETGDALFPSIGGVFWWDGTTGARSRILQMGDPHPGRVGLGAGGDGQGEQAGGAQRQDQAGAPQQRTGGHAGSLRDSLVRSAPQGLFGGTGRRMRSGSL